MALPSLVALVMSALGACLMQPLAHLKVPHMHAAYMGVEP